MFGLNLPVDARRTDMGLILTVHGASRVETNVVAVISSLLLVRRCPRVWGWSGGRGRGKSVSRKQTQTQMGRKRIGQVQYSQLGWRCHGYFIFSVSICMESESGGGGRVVYCPRASKRVLSMLRGANEQRSLR